jgi:hypothetical protein
MGEIVVDGIGTESADGEAYHLDRRTRTKALGKKPLPFLRSLFCYDS